MSHVVMEMETVKLISRLGKDENGAMLLEYPMPLGIVLVTVFATVTIVGTWISGQWTTLARKMQRDRRKAFRVEWNLPSTIYDAGRHLECSCIVSDISSGGAKITGVKAKTIPDEFKLGMRFV